MQGFNMGIYVPPDLEGTLSANAASGKGHSLGARASKLKSHGILTVRFECPFAIWCDTCKPEQIIGQGVRFNAEKKKVGNYYSTPIWSFRFKHTVCGGWLEVRTDPKNTEYVVVEGGRRRDYGEVEDGLGRERTTEEEKDRLEKDGGFGAVEKKVEDKKKLLSESERLEELKKRSERDWEDPYEMSKKLRKGFRPGRKERKDAEVRGEALKEKLSLGIDLVEEREEDTQRAKFIEFGTNVPKEIGDLKPLFAQALSSKLANPPPDGGKGGKKPTAEQLVAAKKAKLQGRLTGNTRAAIDPFASPNRIWQPKVRQKMVSSDTSSVPVAGNLALVEYNSDSA
jgi:coiled-coil domain-containing protein 130